MKNIILKLCTLFTLLIGAVFAQTEEIPIDSTTAGRAFARNLWDRYQFSGDFTTAGNNNYQYFKGTMDLRGQITALQVDGVIIVEDGDAPLPGLPYPTGGTITNFWLSLQAITGDDVIAWGGTYMPRLPEGQALTVTLYPEEERGFVEYRNPSNSIRPLLVNSDGQEVGYYDSNYNGFHYYIDPLKGPITAYVMVNNIRVASIWLEPFISPETMDNNMVNVELIGGVTRVMMNKYGYYSQTSATEGQTEVNGVMMPAKVFLLDTEGSQHHLTIHTEENTNLSVKIYDVENNRLDLLAELDSWDDGYDIRYWESKIPQGYGKILVVVTSTDGAPKSFRAFFSEGGIRG